MKLLDQVREVIRKKHYSISTEQAMECVRLRVKDIDFEQNQVIVREGKESRKGDCFAVGRNSTLFTIVSHLAIISRHFLAFP